MTTTTSGLRARPLPPIARRVLASPFFDALATPHGISRYLEQVSPLWSLDDERAVVTDVRRETDDAVTLTLRRTGDHLPHRAGQHVRLAVEVDGARKQRAYSITDAEQRADGHVTLTVRAHESGTVSRFLNDHATPGLVVGLSAPAGGFVLPAPRPDRVVLVSGGSGITPVMAMLRTLLAEGHTGHVTFLHYARCADAVIYRDELAAIDAAHANVDVVIVTTREDATAHGLRGHVRRDHLDAVAPDRAAAQTFACGPLALLDELERCYLDDGIADRFNREQFVAPTIVLPDGDATGAVRFASTGVTVTNDGTTLLEQAEAAGLRPESGCRMGICHSCTRTVACGPTRNVLTGEVTDEPDRAVQLCISVPAGDVDLDL